LPKAYSYVRFSTPEQAKGDSQRRQEKMARDYALRNNLELDETLTFRDLGVSAYRGTNANSGQLGDFLAAVKEGIVEQGSYLLVENLDRVSRQTPRKAARVLEDIVDAGVNLVTVSDEKVYSKQSLDEDPFGFVMIVLSFVRAHDESVQKGRRVRTAWGNKRALAATRPLTARCPAWLRLRPDRSGFEVLEDRAAIVRRIFEMAAGGAGQQKIATTLNEGQVATWGDAGRKPAQHWRRSYIVKLLRSPAVVGVFTPHTIETVDGAVSRVPGEAVPGYFPPVVSDELYRAVQSLQEGAASPSRGRHAAAPVQNILGGLAKCGRCGGTMTRVSKGSRSKAGRPYLVCEAAKVGKTDASGNKLCAYRAVPLDQIETALREDIWEAIEQAPTPGETSIFDATIAGLEEEIAQAEGRIARLVEAIEQGGSPTLRDRLRSVENERDAAKAELQKMQDRRAAAHGPFLTRRLSALREALEAEPFDLARANLKLREACSSVVVDYEACTLAFEWTHGGWSGLAYGWPGVTTKPRKRPSNGR